MTMKSEENRSRKPSAEESTRGGSLGPTKDAHKQHRPRTTDEALDEALEESFPASDPPARSEPVTHVGAKTKHEKKPD